MECRFRMPLKPSLPQQNRQSNLLQLRLRVHTPRRGVKRKIRLGCCLLSERSVCYRGGGYQEETQFVQEVRRFSVACQRLVS